MVDRVDRRAADAVRCRNGQSAVSCGTCTCRRRLPRERPSCLSRKSRRSATGTTCGKTFPAARFVYLVRDPRDMALSWKKSAAIRGGVVRAAQAWHRDQRGFASIVAALQASRHVFSTTYERLLSHPAETLAAIMRFLDCEYEPAQLEFYRSEDARKWRLPPGTSPISGVP